MGKVSFNLDTISSLYTDIVILTLDETLLTSLSLSMVPVSNPILNVSLELALWSVPAKGF